MCGRRVTARPGHPWASYASGFTRLHATWLPSPPFAHRTVSTFSGAGVLGAAVSQARTRPGPHSSRRGKCRAPRLCPRGKEKPRTSPEKVSCLIPVCISLLWLWLILRGCNIVIELLIQPRHVCGAAFAIACADQGHCGCAGCFRYGWCRSSIPTATSRPQRRLRSQQRSLHTSEVWKGCSNILVSKIRAALFIALRSPGTHIVQCCPSARRSATSDTTTPVLGHRGGAAVLPGGDCCLHCRECARVPARVGRSRCRRPVRPHGKSPIHISRPSLVSSGSLTNPRTTSVRPMRVTNLHGCKLYAQE